ncbi:MAG: DUF4157 domain-containing protein [Thermoleophilia bacterium]|nr:DUF4157 domain-containing protein [Thermoleophilia bacterium]
MNIAPAAAAASAASHGPIPGWSPTIKAAIPSSTRANGLLRAGIDAWRGIPEQAGGVRLSQVMVDTLAPFYATNMQLDEATVRTDLSNVHVVLGGPAHDAGGMATTIGRTIYVSDAKRAAHMLSWDGRRWLAHELVHTMQWRQSNPASAATDSQRDRSFLNTYLGKYVADQGSISKGGLVTALRAWLKSRDDHASDAETDGIGEIIHDTHPMERQAEQLGRAFRDQTA